MVHLLTAIAEADIVETGGRPLAEGVGLDTDVTSRIVGGWSD